MKICLITTDDRDERKLYNLDEPVYGAAPLALIQGFEMLGAGIDVHVVSCTRKVLPLKQSKGCIHHHFLKVSPLLWKSAYLGCILKIRHLVKYIKPCIVHGQGTERYCAMSAAFSGVKNAVTILGNMRAIARRLGARFPAYFWRASVLENIALRNANAVFSNSLYTRDCVKSVNSCLYDIPNAVRLNFFQKAMPVRSHSNIPTLLNIGSIISYKRPLELVKQAVLWRNEGIQFRIKFIGNCPNDEYGLRFKSEIKAHSEFCSHIDYLPVDLLIDEMDRADALIHVSVEESFGLVVAESMARNLRIFATSSGGVRDILRGQNESEIFAEEDWDALGSSLSRWIKAGFPSAKYAHSIAYQRYHPQTIARLHIEAYRQVLK